MASAVFHRGGSAFVAVVESPSLSTEALTGFSEQEKGLEKSQRGSVLREAWMNHPFLHHSSTGRSSPYRSWKRSFSLSMILALLLQGLIAVLPGSAGMQVAQAAGPGGTSGSVTYTTLEDFNQACATLDGVTVTGMNPDGEVRLRASLEDYFDGNDVNTTLWEEGYFYDWYDVYPVVSGGVVTLDGNYLHSLTSFNQSGRFVEARALIRANPGNLSTPGNAANIDIGYYRNLRPWVQDGDTNPITADTALRLFLTENGGSNNLKVRLADGTNPWVDDDIPDPDLTQWHIFRIEWGAVDTSYYIDGSLVSTLPEMVSNGDTLYARILLFHLNPSGYLEPLEEPPGLSPMQVDWIRGGQYPASGSYTSCVYDAGGVVNFSDVAWDASVPSGSGLTIQRRTSLDNASWSNWSSPIDASAGSSDTSDSPSGRYLQYRLNYTSSSLIETAELQQITFNYFGPTGLEVSPASVTLDPGATQTFTATARDANNREVTGLTVSWSSSVGSINPATGQFTAPLPAGTTSNAVTATVNLSGGGTLTGNASVTVRDLPPSASAGGPYSVDEGSSINLTASGSDPNGTGVSYAWDLDNNGTFETSGQTVSFSRDDNGSYPVTVRVTDGTSQSTTAGATVTVVNVAPTASFGVSATTVDEGGSVTLSLTSPSDPSSADMTAGFTYAFDCGTGTFGSYSGSNSTSCGTTDNGTFTVRGRIRDKDGGVNTYSATVTVVNVAPTASFGVSATTVDEGGSVTLSLTSPSDPSSADMTAGFTYAFDCGTGTFGTPGSASSVSCTMGDAGNLTVRGKIIDKDGGETSYSNSVTVNNIAPEITEISNNGPVLTYQPVQIVVTVSSYAGDTLSYEFDCDNNGVYEVGPQSGNTGVCTFSQKGTYTVGVRVSDDDGASDTGTTEVEVKSYLLFLPLVVRNP
ncbi:MAG TPA: hypothetical protein DEQ80_06265 [Anaerolinea thermolimosa]|uniref:PKD domain-containing protein n=1 Tax=Anaerolinea thermolimosa TaxID=229919 RepID=A0A3D1JGU0_9CHLR|nr:hypothetical protein [Anaerolinea thermolimosa]